MVADARDVPRQEVIDALDDIGISDDWEVAAQLRGGLVEAVEVADLPKRLNEPSPGFRNQVVGRIAERVFRSRHLSRLEPV